MAEAPKKLNTQEILAAARAQAAKVGGGAPAAEPAPAPESEPAASAPEPVPATAAPKPAAKPVAKPAAGKKPGSTADILAAARAQAATAVEGESAAPAAPATTPKPPVASAAGGKPKSTADILAAARAAAAAKSGAPAAEPAAAEKPAAKEKPKAPVKGVAAKTAPAPADGPRLSVEEMLAAVRPAAASTAPIEHKAVKPAGPPPMPAKPQPSGRRPTAAAAASSGVERRGFLAGLGLGLLAGPLQLVATPFALAWTLFAATTGIATLAMARMMLPNVLTEPPRKFKIGPPSDYDLGTVATKLVAAYGVWIVHTDQYKGKNLIYALASVCTHLGCTPSWLEGEQKFKCPCHGSGFYITGVNFEGPAPRPLERVAIRLAEDGMLEVDKSLKFQEEMGQWNDGASYYEVVG